MTSATGCTGRLVGVRVEEDVILRRSGGRLFSPVLVCHLTQALEVDAGIGWHFSGLACFAADMDGGLYECKRFACTGVVGGLIRLNIFPTDSTNDGLLQLVGAIPLPMRLVSLAPNNSCGRVPALYEMRQNSRNSCRQ